MRAIIQKITKAKKVGGMAPVVECLSSKHKALSQTPVLPPKKTGRKKKKPQMDQTGVHVSV
jgi:hypothetical protein